MEVDPPRLQIVENFFFFRIFNLTTCIYDQIKFEKTEVNMLKKDLVNL